MIIKNKVEINCSVIELLPSRIIKLRYKPDFEIQLKDVRELETVFVHLAGENDIYCLMDMSGRFNTVTKEAQNFLSKEAAIVTEKKLKASAIVIDNLPNRIITKFFIKFFKPSFKTKIFSKIEQAEAWLIELREINN